MARAEELPRVHPVGQGAQGSRGRGGEVQEGAGVPNRKQEAPEPVEVARDGELPQVRPAGEVVRRGTRRGSEVQEDAEASTQRERAALQDLTQRPQLATKQRERKSGSKVGKENQQPQPAESLRCLERTQKSTRKQKD